MSANLYSLIDMAKANNLNPYDYLERIFKEMPDARNVDNIDNLLPWVVVNESTVVMYAMSSLDDSHHYLQAVAKNKRIWT